MIKRPAIHLKRGREKKLRSFYPWVQRGEIAAFDVIEDGTIIRVLNEDGEFVATGTYNSGSRFPVRVLSLKDEEIDEAWFAGRIAKSVAMRDQMIHGTNARRIIFSEADGLPGLIVDDFDGHLIVQVRSLGMERLRSLWLPALLNTVKPKSAFEKSDMAGRLEESMKPLVQPLFGELPDELWIEEDGLKFKVPVIQGLKTGFYVDQRNSRRLLAQQVKPGEKVLDCFCYTGGFGMHASRAGARVIGVDIHDVAVATARANITANKLEYPIVHENAFDFLEKGAAPLGPYDWIILDPPAIAKTKESHDSLKWAIWKLVSNALPMVKPGGKIIVCNCSYQVSLKETIETCRLASADVSSNLVLEQVTFQDLDHPAPISFPESLYLKCVWLRKA